MEGETKTFKAKFNAHGFVPGVDVSEGEWEKATAEFVTLQHWFAEMSNQVLGRLNEMWQKYEFLRKYGGCTYEYLMQQAMEISETATYNDWIEKWYKDICEALDKMAAISRFSVRTHLFREEDVPLLGVEFTNKPDWWIDLELVPVE